MNLFMLYFIIGGEIAEWVSEWKSIEKSFFFAEV